MKPINQICYHVIILMHKKLNQPHNPNKMNQSNMIYDKLQRLLWEDDLEGQHWLHAAQQISNILLFNTNFAVNFLLYCLSGRNFRKSLWIIVFKRIANKACCWRSRGKSSITVSKNVRFGSRPNDNESITFEENTCWTEWILKIPTSCMDLMWNLESLRISGKNTDTQSISFYFIVKSIKEDRTILFHPSWTLISCKNL